MQALLVAAALLVEDDEVDTESEKAPVGVGKQRLPDDFHIPSVTNRDEDDRQIARDAVFPEIGLSQLVSMELRLGNSQPGAGIEEGTGQLLEALEVVGCYPKLTSNRCPQADGGFKSPASGLDVSVLV